MGFLMKTYSQFIKENAVGLYTFRRLNPQSSEFLYEWMEENRIPNHLPLSELHCTVVQSEIDIPGYTIDPTPVMIYPATYKIAMMNEALTIQFKSDALVEQWQRAMNMGGKSKFPTFIPHITMSYEVPLDYDSTDLKPPLAMMVLQGEEQKAYANDGKTSINEYTIGDMTLGGGPGIYVPQTSLNMPREEMPQITQKNTMEFIDWLENQGVTVQFLSMPVALMRCAQGNDHVDPKKVMALQNSPAISTKPFIISKDNFVLDGIHRWLAILNRDPHYSVNTYRVNLPFTELLQMTKKFGKVFYKP
jgi:hypothetical protein